MAFVRYLAASAGVGVLVACLTFALLTSLASRDRATRVEPAADIAAATPVESDGKGGPHAPIPAAAESFQDGSVQLAVHEPESSLAPKVRDISVIEGVLTTGESLAESMGHRGIGPDVVHVIATEMRPHFDFRRAQPGHEYVLTRDATGRPVSFRYRTSPIKAYELRLEGEDYVVDQLETALEHRAAHVAGVVSTTLYSAVTGLGAEPQVANDFTDIFAWDVDFTRAVRPGDEFKILYERLVQVDPEGNEVFVRPGKILAARYSGAAGEHAAMYFEIDEGRGGYYRPDGTAVERHFLQAPLRYSKITSRYSTARRHPILKVTRPHYGIDYAAPHGTQLWSVADGEVIYRGWAGGFGNLVKIRHANGYVSFYAHLTRFAKGLRVGDRVGQKQLIGYVGSTGLATGPHVCFRVTKDGKYVNPATARLRSPTAPPVPGEMRPLFDGARDTLLAQLDAGPAPLLVIDEAL